MGGREGRTEGGTEVALDGGEGREGGKGGYEGDKIALIIRVAASVIIDFRSL